MLWKRNNFCSLCNKSYAVSFPMLDLNFFFFFQGWVSTLLIKETVSLLFWLGLFNNKRAYRNYKGSTVTKQVPPSDGACKLHGETGGSSLTWLSCPVWLDFHPKWSSLSIGSRFWRLRWKRQNAQMCSRQTWGALRPCRVELLQDSKSLFYPTILLREERERLKNNNNSHS